MINVVALNGRLTKDIELRYFTNGNAVTNFTLAIPRDHKNSDGVYETDFIDIELTGKLAELMAQYCKKGDLIALRGRIEKKMWIDKEDKKHYNTYVRADKVSFLSTKKEEIDDKYNIKTESNGLDSLGIEIEDSDLPF